MKFYLFTERLSLTVRMVVGNTFECISIPFLKWHTLNLHGDWSLTSAINELENNRSIIRTSWYASKENKKKKLCKYSIFWLK
jgi:hypothetical protein